MSTPALGIVQNLPSTITRPRPRVPEYLRESFNLSELCKHTTDNESVPRNMPPKFQPVTQPPHLPEPTVYGGSQTSHTGSNTSVEALGETATVKASPGKFGKIPSRIGSGKKHVLLPPSSFVHTKKPSNDVDENPFSQGVCF